jgi:uncharacterized phiE125 gp8 family phage protein
MGLKLITPATGYPITLSEAKLQVRGVDGTEEDAYINGLIAAATQAAEHITENALMAQTWELGLDAFASEICLPRPPLASITSVKYLDEEGVLQTMAQQAWLLDDHSRPARLMPAYGTTWPATRCQANAVLIRYVAGYPDAATVPQEIKSWMLIRIGTLYANRESVVVGASVAGLSYVDRLLDSSRSWSM